MQGPPKGTRPSTRAGLKKAWKPEGSMQIYLKGGVPNNKDYSILGSIMGPLFWETTNLYTLNGVVKSVLSSNHGLGLLQIRGTLEGLHSFEASGPEFSF